MARPTSILPLLALVCCLAAPAAAADVVTIGFADGAAILDGRARHTLDEIAGRLTAEPGLRLRLVAYAGPSDADGARRLSLARARATWLHLTGKGVPGPRIAVFALGDQAAKGDPDRIDVFVEGQ